MKLKFDRSLGLHFRLEKDLSTLAQKALNYNLNSFQFFLLQQDSGKYVNFTKEDINNFLSLKNKYFKNIYIHTSYWINIASTKPDTSEISKQLLKKEINQAKELEIKYLILHPGCASKNKKNQKDPLGKKSGIKNIAKTLNLVLKKENNVKILLENIAHANSNIGNDLKDLFKIKQHLDHPEKVKFCLDLAHAFAYGYDLKSYINFFSILEKYIDLESIKLIHLNDSASELASKIDKHALPGNGHIGQDVLKNIINHKELKNIPLIIEPPKNTTEEEKKYILNKIQKSWFV